MLGKPIYMICFLMVISCTVPKKNLRERYVGESPELKSEIKQAIRNADIIVGMNKEQVLASRATPIYKGERERDNKIYEFWTYPDLKGSPFANVYFLDDVVVEIEKTDRKPPIR
jgi:hypothetical protein